MARTDKEAPLAASSPRDHRVAGCSRVSAYLEVTRPGATGGESVCCEEFEVSPQDHRAGWRARRGTLHFLTPLWRGPQRAFVTLFRRYFDRAPGWVVLTTRGRRTGLPREVLLPCRRIENDVLVLSAYGRRSDWMRNVLKDARVSVTCNGRERSARAEIVEEASRKRALLWRDPFLLPAPFAILQALSWTLLRPVFFVLAWPIVASRPLVLMHLEGPEDGQGRPDVQSESTVREPEGI